MTARPVAPVIPGASPDRRGRSPVAQPRSPPRRAAPWRLPRIRLFVVAFVVGPGAAAGRIAGVLAEAWGRTETQDADEHG